MTAAGSASPLVPRTLAVCGFKDSGKTTLLVEAVRELRRRGLSVGVVKTDAHGIRVDAEGTDSARLFDAGAEVVVRGPGESLARRRTDADAEEAGPSEASARRLSRRHDLVLIEGGKGSRGPKIWLGRRGEPDPPAAVGDVLLTLPWGGDRLRRLMDRLDAWLDDAWSSAPLAGGVLAGGGGRRMGRSKETLEVEGKSLLQRTGEVLAGRADPIVRLGGLGGPWPSLPDVPGLEGPPAGMVAATRWLPESTWIFLACDQPRFRREALDWLLSRRSPGAWAVVPSVEGIPQPLCAAYEPMAAPLLESLARSESPAPSRLAGRRRIRTPEVPAELSDAFRSANTPEDWQDLTGLAAGSGPEG